MKACNSHSLYCKWHNTNLAAGYTIFKIYVKYTAFVQNITEQAAVNAFAEVTDETRLVVSVHDPSVDSWLTLIMSCLSYVPFALLMDEY